MAHFAGEDEVRVNGLQDRAAGARAHRYGLDLVVVLDRGLLGDGDGKALGGADAPGDAFDETRQGLGLAKMMRRPAPVVAAVYSWLVDCLLAASRDDAGDDWTTWRS